MTKKTLVIIDHPSFSESKIHRKFVDELRKHPDEITIHTLQSAYPSGMIDVPKEHSLLSNHGAVVLEFPMYWFNSPAKMIEWLDKVLTSDWAFKGKYSLENKKVALCISCGSEEASYTPDGRNHRKAEDYLANYLRAFEMCHMNYAGLFALYGVNDAETVDAEAISQSAKDYVEFIRKLSE